jgi:hypothetical protein
MSFDKMMIHYCAPTLCGIKSGNMFFIKNDVFSENNFNQWKETFSTYGILTFAIQLSNFTTGILTCNVCWVRKILDDAMVNAYLHGKGYNSTSVFDFVEIFSNRIKTQKGFPHEIGVILGYPIDDVIEFEKHQGRNCKYCGYWKTYTDIEKAKDCKCRYKNCSCLCEKWYKEGYSIIQIIQEYKKIDNAA